jgi:putative molybdopterin biosynthesis protein
VRLEILAAARALDLDFVPLLEERYDLVIPHEFYESDRLAPLFEIVRQPEFRRDVTALGGYGVSATGAIVAELP